MHIGNAGAYLFGKLPCLFRRGHIEADPARIRAQAAAGLPCLFRRGHIEA